LGANFKELIGVLKYQPIGRLNLTGKLIHAWKGTNDFQPLNYGGDILRSNNSRAQELGNKIGQGTPYTLTFASFTASYMIKHNVFIDLQLIMRKDNYQYNGSTPIVPGTYTGGSAMVNSLAVRWNIAPRNYDF
jgi:hypothetical protein